MSVQFGRWNHEGAPPAPELLEKVQTLMETFGPDGSHSYCAGGVDILYSTFHTTKESRAESQPLVTRSGAVLTWDGRLDNRAEFMTLMSDRLEPGSPDVSVVATAYERWGTRCFARLLGDWALSIWDPNNRLLTLAKDPIGTRPLYYSVQSDQISWSSILDPLVLFPDRQFELEEEYIAGWFSFFPSTSLTPYVGIESVPPSCFICLGPDRKATTKYWDFDPANRIHCRSDAEFEERFRAVLSTAVERRLRSDAPIVAELSGGLDSSSIVCMADKLIAGGAAHVPRVDTLSYYDDSEPNWNERPFFTKVEERRGRTGCHIDVGGAELFSLAQESESFAATPGSDGGGANATTRQVAACLASQGNRVVLSGIGGDEVTGGVPTPTPELMDLAASAHLRRLAHQLKAWALNKRKPWFHLAAEAARGFLPPALAGVPQHMRPVPWLAFHFVKRHRSAVTGYPSRVRLFGSLPSFQENVSTLDGLRRQLACSPLPSQPPFEKRYPYLDRDFLEFMYAVPREQLVRPGQRRSLMRRALTGIVPDELLQRKRKAFVTRSPFRAISRDWTLLEESTECMVSSALGIVDPKLLIETLAKARDGRAVPIVMLARTFAVERWLRGLTARGVLVQHAVTEGTGRGMFRAEQAPTDSRSSVQTGSAS
jgi:asparagine synthase (glutamine-hydrolysing)